MQFPMTVGLHRSFLGSLAIVAAHLLAAAIMVLPRWTPIAKAMLIAGVAGSAFLASRRQPTIDCLRLSDDGRLKCRLAGTSAFAEAELAAATVHPWLTVMPLKIAGKRHVLLIFPDSIHYDDFRRLRIWLRWCANFNAARSVV